MQDRCRTDSLTPDERTTHHEKQIHFLFLTGWLIPVGVALVFFVIPTLKGGSFDLLYDLHRVRYLDTTLVCVAVAFAWLTVAVFKWARKQTAA